MLVFVLCTLCCQFLWIVHFWLLLLYSLTFICFVYLRLVYPILHVSLDCSFLLFLLYSLTFMYQKIIRSKDVIISALARIPLVKHIRSFRLLYLYFFDKWILITPLVSSNSLCTYSLYFNLFKHIIIIEFKLKKS